MIVPTVAVLLALSIFNLFTSVRRLTTWQTGTSKPDYSKSHTSRRLSERGLIVCVGYVGSDYPVLLPLSRPLTRVPMVLENTTHYPIDGPTAAAQWESVYPPGFGFVRLGEPRRILCVSMFHQLHCVEKFRLALHNPDDPIATIPHLQHCMNYIRQMVLCASDLTLEPVDMPAEGKERVGDWEMDGEASGAGVEHLCWDWSLIYETLGQNWANWLEFWDRIKDTVPHS